MIVLGLFLVLVIFFIVDKGVRKWLNIEKSEGTSRYVNRFHILGTIALLALFFMVLSENNGGSHQDMFASGQAYTVIALLIISQLFDGYMHWRYHKNPREYVITLIFLAIMIVVVAVAFIMNLLLG